LLQTPEQVPMFAAPYDNDDGVLKWTTEIKGAELLVTGAEHIQSPWPGSNVPGIFVIHTGNAVIAMVV
ncbi:hypothetical protein PQQ51_34395, partial [Paraburkholderia xenovorans]|uniref:hypothetical protein n=1 Tax=Paraburkholderia xenovorans TaxID=36873 RepID=UPI0038BDDEEF